MQPLQLLIRTKPSTSSIPSSRVTFMDTIANSFNWTSSKTQSPAEIRERIRDILTEKQQLDNHPGYNEARVRLDAISAIKRNINQIVDVLELVWKPAVTDCRSIRNLFERIKQARSPELIQHELRSANTLYDFLADSLDAYAIGMKDIEEQLQNLM
ncbi:hypothetical protein FRC03_005696 [Tulasnella sp. 419]|nr:hypothetical protein FRC03_005696 [Tulasnella sp. 419]